MIPSRRSQPFRQDSLYRQPGDALYQMLQGRSVQAPNPMDVHRKAQVKASLFTSLLRKP